MITIKRAYEAPAAADGRRFLIDRLWPRGVRKVDAALDECYKDVSPSTELRRWFGHDPDRWAEFQQRYRAELDAKPDAWQPLLDAARQGHITLIYSAHDSEHNDAVVLRDYLMEHLH
ncbi:MAG: DUF488 domain-containing protein [Candidatus Promineofilum sp.]|nr:DUF488 domain-containing protein [Promineifilum sp.]